MTANIHPDTGIAYGYIRADNLHPYILDTITYDIGTDVHYKEALEEFCRDPENRRDSFGHFLSRDAVEQRFADNYLPDEPVYEGEYQGVRYRTSWLGGAQHVWIFSSPVIWNCKPCSICVPNAGNLDQAGEGGYEAYGVPASWLDGGFLEDRMLALDARIVTDDPHRWDCRGNLSERFLSHDSMLENFFEKHVYSKKGVSHAVS